MFFSSARSSRVVIMAFVVVVALHDVVSQDLSEIPSDLTFSCSGKSYGYYADVSTNCKVFHICLGDGDVKWSFLCPNQTSFSQQYFVCDYDVNVDCKSSEIYYNLNENFGQVVGKDGEQQQQQQRLARQQPFVVDVDVEEPADVDEEAEAAASNVNEISDAKVTNDANDANDANDFAGFEDVEETTFKVINDEKVEN